MTSNEAKQEIGLFSESEIRSSLSIRRALFIGARLNGRRKIMPPNADRDIFIPSLGGGARIAGTAPTNLYRFAPAEGACLCVCLWL